MSTSDTQVLYEDDECEWVVFKYGEGRLGTFPQESDARLFAAAPELLEALRKLVHYGREEGESRVNEEFSYAWEDACRAIAKAEGRGE